jgi:hypothetical protein
MILVLEIVMLIAGIAALVKGEIKWSKSRVTTGMVARIVGIIMLLPLPLAFTAGFVLGAVQAATRHPANVASVRVTAIVIEVVIVLVCFLLALTVGLVSAHPPAKKRPRREEWYEEDEAPDSDYEQPAVRPRSVTRYRSERLGTVPRGCKRAQHARLPAETSGPGGSLPGGSQKGSDHRYPGPPGYL